jgi:hypothetical protein
MEVANTLAYYDRATITAVKNFIVQDPGPCKTEGYSFWYSAFNQITIPKALAYKKSEYIYPTPKKKFHKNDS